MFTEQPFKAILDRDKHEADAEEYFSEVIKLMQDMTNYGTNLIIRCLGTSSRQLEDAIILGVIVRQAVAMFDAFEILVSKASIYPAHLQTRALFEASLYLDFILKDQVSEKAKSYYVAHLREERLWASRTQPESSEKIAFEKTLAPFELGEVLNNETTQTEAAQQIADIDRLLTQSELIATNKALDDIKNSMKRPFEPVWYAPFLNAIGRKVSIRQLADEVGRLHEYDIFYSITSKIMHSSGQKHHIKFKQNQLHITPIRLLENIDMLLMYTIGTIIQVYIKVLKHYRPGELDNFSRKYVVEWRETFHSIKPVKYEVSGESELL